MALGLLLILITLFIGSITGDFKIGYLLVYSFGLLFYYLWICISKHTRLTKLGMILCIVAIFGVAYSMCVLIGIDVMSLF